MVSSSEISRKMLHLFNLIIPFGYLYIIPNKNTMTLIVIGISIIFVIIDLARNQNRFVGNLIRKLFSFMMRKHELDGKFTGATWVVLVSIPVIYFFPKDIAVLSLIFMSVGDTAAAIGGQAFGRIKLGNKSLEGSMACLIVCIIVSIFFDSIPFSISLIGAFSATVFEALPINIDDNILMPLGSGFAMILASIIIG